MDIRVPYKDINQTLNGIHRQVVDSLDYCANNMPIYPDPQSMFYGLKQLIKYHNDPTLFENNWWGIPGAGDCDCFSILVLSMACVHNFGPQRIVLCGRSRIAPVHIFTQLKVNGDWKTLDLTRPLYNTHKPYKFYQHLPC
jgi:hypothetical protein